MTTIEQTIKEAGAQLQHEDVWLFNNVALTEAEILMLPTFWQALGKARGWEVKRKGVHRGENDDAWLYQWHRFIDHLADGGDSETFFKDLTPDEKDI